MEIEPSLEVMLRDAAKHELILEQKMLIRRDVSLQGTRSRHRPIQLSADPYVF